MGAEALSEQLRAAESALARLSTTVDSHETTLHAVLDLVEHCGWASALSDAAGRRDYTQAWIQQVGLGGHADQPLGHPAPQPGRVGQVPRMDEHRRATAAQCWRNVTTPSSSRVTVADVVADLDARVSGGRAPVQLRARWAATCRETWQNGTSRCGAPAQISRARSLKILAIFVASAPLCW